MSNNPLSIVIAGPVAVDETGEAIGNATTQSTFVFEPNGVAGGNVFKASATLIAAMALSSGEKWVLVNTSLGAAHLSGALGDLTGVHWTASAPGTVLSIDAGSTFSFRTMYLHGGITVTMAAAAAMFTPSAQPELFIHEGSTFKNTTATAPIVLSGANMSVIEDEFSTCGDGTHPIVAVSAGKTTLFQLFTGSALNAHSVAGLGTCIAEYDSSSVPSNQADVTTFTKIMLDDASAVSYTPGVPGNWVGAAPTTVQQALDRIAANTLNAHPIP